MADIKFKGNDIQTAGNIPQKGDKLPDFKLVDKGMEEKSAEDFKGKRLVLNIFPSVDTGTCATSVRNFNEKASGMNNVTVLNISRDLPFAQKRFGENEGLENVQFLSEFRDRNFSDNYQVEMRTGPLSGLMSRAVVVADENGQVLYSEQVPEISQEPDYLSALKTLL